MGVMYVYELVCSKANGSEVVCVSGHCCNYTSFVELCSTMAAQAWVVHGAVSPVDSSVRDSVV